MFEPGGPGEIRPDGSLAMKFPFMRGEGVVGYVEITGRKVDGSAERLTARIPREYGQEGFQSTLLVFSRAGCWQVVVTAGSARLEFVTKVTRAATSS